MLSDLVDVKKLHLSVVAKTKNGIKKEVYDLRRPEALVKKHPHWCYRQTCFVAALDPPTCILSLYLSRKIMSCYKLAFFGQNRKK